MNLEEFDRTYAHKKGADKIEIYCDHPDHPADLPVLRELGKTAARRNILKNSSEKFICRDCCMKFDNPMNKTGENRQTNEIISVQCPKCGKIRDLKKACYFGNIQEPYQQICGSCVQEGKVISDEQRERISNALAGRELSEEHKANIMAYRENNPEWRDKAIKNLVPGMGGIARKGLPLPEEWKSNISKGTSGKKKTLEHRYHISQGRKKMLEDTGGFTEEHRRKISDATIQQYRDGFVPHTHHLRGWHYSPKLGKCVYYRSSYEKRAFMLLDADPTIAEYIYEAVIVDYKHPEKNVICQYLVDLLIRFPDGKEKIIEIKPEKCAEYPMNIAKIEAAKQEAQERGCKFEIWTETELYGKENTEKKKREFSEWLKGINHLEQEPHGENYSY